MNPEFRGFIDDFPGKYLSLVSMKPKKIDAIKNDTLEGGVYMFSEGPKNLYVGRTKRNIKSRLKDHVCKADDCPFAFRLAREKTGKTRATYRQIGSRKDLLSRPDFRAAYEESKERIRKMDVRYIEENNPLKQALLEIYVAVASNAKYNDFDTH